MPFEFIKTSVDNVYIIRPKVFEDNRGYFMETFEKRSFSNLDFNVIQENQSYSRKGVLRGLHFQKGKFAQAKIVRVIKGEIFDVAVDIRPDSKTFKKYVSAILSDKNKEMLYIPRGFAHGFEVLSDEAIVVYLVDNFYSPENEGGIIWNDKDINIDWPIKEPILSKKDSSWPTLKQFLENERSEKR
ncbi:dTDP-4-dehydrorhamnose 3,5-epimerase [Caldisphaera lagunensis DSM 15908]|uniref:dTDP-4-dehydrorhamnose 3,5-epimerase n=1 Tax=Caldisphaera lagunensis (strain DSM 15908 / JCM 11604 / ANMR 0165 / IC-154) TaxID=1056495 RepID=L0AC23_CALLD|nr:dTDP-4-dehydrorhamnose 3,5-epimerase [Caldisphaera lagunensis]AFZ70672.1 dTDP-4-dehydrorhamnose 3,5-epimerase [Caldisphaera lagunensis DSM 15908]